MKPYSLDLRSKIYNYSLTHTIRETAKIFGVSPDTVHLLRKLFIETSSLSPRERSSEYPHLITPTGETYLKLLLDFIGNLFCIFAKLLILLHRWQVSNNVYWIKKLI